MFSKTENGLLTVNLGALRQNYKMFKKIAREGCDIAGVIKANGYGLGALNVFNILKSEGCPQFFVATLDEALFLRKHDSATPIAVLGGLFKGAEEDYIARKITPVLNTPDDIERWQKIAKTRYIQLPAILHFDTGMNRLGLSADEAAALINAPSQIDGLDVISIMSHFACADDKDDPMTGEQAKIFAALATHFPDSKKSLANSPGLFADKAYHYDMARPGYALYGGNPTPHTHNPMHRVADLKVRVLQTRACKKGESIGYGASHTFDKDTRTATIAMGYADGFLRSHSSKGQVYFNNTPCPVLGRVSMDLVTIDISDAPALKQGDWVEVLGKNQSVDDVAKAAGTIGYEILTSLGNRYKREYISG